METDGLKILLVLEPKWIASLNGVEFLPFESSDISIQGSTIRLGASVRTILSLEWLRPDIVRIQARQRFRGKSDTITLYPGERLPPGTDLRRRRRAFQTEMGKALCAYFGISRIYRQTLYSDRRHGIGGAYPRFLIGRHAVIAVDPDESSTVINGLMRAALLWKPLVNRPVVAVIPRDRKQCIATRLRVMPEMRHGIQWLQWDGARVQPFEDSGEQPETYVQPFAQYQDRQSARHDPSGFAHQERMLESKITGEICHVLPSMDAQHIYPQVPSFAGEERNIIDLLGITENGRLVVIEIKASPDPDLPFQALDYWIAVERHRMAGDFQRNGYFAGCELRSQPALLLLVAPLLEFHRTSRQLIGSLPPQIPLMEIGLNQTWQKEIKVLRRKGMLS